MIYPLNFEHKIGFDQIRQLLSEKCLSTLGVERVTDMAFSDHYEEVEERLNLVTEFIRIIEEEDNFPAQYFFDVRPSLKRIRVEGMYLDEQELFDLRRSLETIRSIEPNGARWIMIGRWSRSSAPLYVRSKRSGRL